MILLTIVQVRMQNQNQNEIYLGKILQFHKLTALVLLRISLSYSHAKYWARTMK